MNRDYTVWLTGRDPCRNGISKCPALMGNLQRVDVNVAALLAYSLCDPKLLRSVWTNQRGILPGEFRQRLRQLLQPAVVCKAAIVDCRVGPENELETANLARRYWARGCWDRGRPARIGCHGIRLRGNSLRRQSCARHKAIVHTLAPPGLKVGSWGSNLRGCSCCLLTASCCCLLPPSFFRRRLFAVCCLLFADC